MGYCTQVFSAFGVPWLWCSWRILTLSVWLFLKLLFLCIRPFVMLIICLRSQKFDTLLVSIPRRIFKFTIRFHIFFWGLVLAEISSWINLITLGFRFDTLVDAQFWTTIISYIGQLFLTSVRSRFGCVLRSVVTCVFAFLI